MATILQKPSTTCKPQHARNGGESVGEILRWLKSEQGRSGSPFTSHLAAMVHALEVQWRHLHPIQTPDTERQALFRAAHQANAQLYDYEVRHGTRT